ncbi:MAG TPA: EAL domain-containing protein [Pseudonocardiaceae bacterium]|nr:EAL domain-containing protein [Pseudonocardiaceae bacterium]
MTGANRPEAGLTTAELASAWARVAGQPSGQQTEQLLARLITRLAAAVAAVPVDDQAAVDVAAELIAHGLTEPLGISPSIDVLAEGLPRLAELREVHRRDIAVLRVLASLAGGYAQAHRQRTLDAQDQATQALQRARYEAELELRICETRFREIFSTSAVGIAISTFDGMVVTANPAFADIVRRVPADIIGASLPELLHAQGDKTLAEAYRRLASGELTRFRHRRKFTATTGEVAWTHIGISVLRDADRLPTHVQTVVENVTELHLLQQELSTQALHDVLTGLPNEQYLMSHLEQVLGTAGPSTMVTLCRLNLDNFSIITDGIDRRAGDAVLRSVAHRLSDLVVGQPAMVARLGADDFAILIQDGPGRLDPQVLAASVNDSLAEPFYLDGHGLAVSAGVGVVHRLATEVSPAELIRAADATMHQAKRSGAGQWALYDAPADALQRARYRHAAEMPGGFESGEVTLRYQPVYALGNGWLVALQALVHWQRRDSTVINHAECLALAQRSGLVIELGHWIVHQSCSVQRVVSQCPTSGSPRMRVDLTPRLSQDPDLLAVVNSALSTTGLPADQLRVGVPLATLARGRGDVLDNVQVLAELGAEVVLFGAGTGTEYLTYLEDLPVGAVELAAEIVSRIAQRPGDDSVVAQAVRQTIPLVHSAGATVLVPGVDTAHQAQWWRDAGADEARGAHFGPPVWHDELPNLLTTAFLDRPG